MSTSFSTRISNRTQATCSQVNEKLTRAEYLAAIAQPKRGNRGANKHRGADGELYDSDVEELMIANLRQLERAGKIRDLKRQVRFDLHAPVRVNGVPDGAECVFVCFAKIDASFFDIEQNRQRWVDAKSDRIRDTALSDLKFKFIKAEYGVVVEKIRLKTPRKRRVQPWK